MSSLVGGDELKNTRGTCVYSGDWRNGMLVWGENLQNAAYRLGDPLSPSTTWAYGTDDGECSLSPDGDACDEGWSYHELDVERRPRALSHRLGMFYNWTQWMDLEMALGMDAAEATAVDPHPTQIHLRLRSRLQRIQFQRVLRLARRTSSRPPRLQHGLLRETGGRPTAGGGAFLRSHLLGGNEFRPGTLVRSLHQDSEQPCCSCHLHTCCLGL